MYWIVRVDTWATVEECHDDPVTDCTGQKAYFKKAAAVEAASRINDAQRTYFALVAENNIPSHIPKAAA